MSESIDVSLVIVSYNTREITRKCLECVRKYAKGISHEVFVVDNASSDGSADMVAMEFPWATLIRMRQNKGFAGGNNPALRQASGKYILLLNSDAFLSEGALSKSIRYMDQNPRTGVLGCKLTNPDGSLQPSARSLPSPLNKILHVTGLASRFSKSKFFGRADFSWWDHSEPRTVGWVVGAFLMIRHQTLEEIGILDERYFLYFEEIDYCLTARRAGWDVVFYPHVQVVHLGGQSSVATNEKISSKGKQSISIRLTSEFRFYRKCHGWAHVLMAASIEFIWNGFVFIKNCFSSSDRALFRRQEAMLIIRLVFSILVNDGWGKRHYQSF